MQAIHARQLERIRHISNIEERDDSARQWRDDLSRLRSARVITQGEYHHWVADINRHIGPYFGVRGGSRHTRTL
jgi:hypothetical protein